MNDNDKAKNFVETYENKLKYIRDLYKRNMFNNLGNNYDHVLVSIFGTLSIIFTVLVLYILEFTMIGYFLSLITLLILTLVYSYFSVKLMNSKSRYLYAIRKRGYRSIEEYEDDISLYLSGPNGFYTSILEDLMKEHNIDEKTNVISDINDIEYYIWKDNDTISILSKSTEELPKVRVYSLDNIRYYRVDMNNNYLVLKTSTDEYQFTLECSDLIKKLLPKKDFNNIKNYNPEEYINDFEIYMHSFKKDIDDKNDIYKDYLINSLFLSISFLVAFIILGILNSTFSKFNIFIDLVSIVIVILLFNKLRKLIRYKILMYTDSDIVYEMNNDNDVINHFNELKVALKITDNYDTISSTGGYPYLVWVANDYLHLFLNVAYYNVVYIVIGLKNDIRYRVKKGETIIKLKDKTYHFEKEANIVFDKLLSKDKNSKKK